MFAWANERWPGRVLSRGSASGSDHGPSSGLPVTCLIQVEPGREIQRGNSDVGQKKRSGLPSVLLAWLSAGFTARNFHGCYAMLYDALCLLQDRKAPPLERPGVHKANAGKFSSAYTTKPAEHYQLVRAQLVTTLS